MPRAAFVVSHVIIVADTVRGCNSRCALAAHNLFTSVVVAPQLRVQVIIVPLSCVFAFCALPARLRFGFGAAVCRLRGVRRRPGGLEERRPRQRRRRRQRGEPLRPPRAPPRGAGL